MINSAYGLAAVAAAGMLCLASMTQANVVRYSVDLDNVGYYHAPLDDGQLLLSIADPAAAGGTVVNFGWDDLSIFVNDNTSFGAPFANWATELLLGYTWGEFSGIEYAQPFPGANSHGAHGPVSASNQHFPSDLINSQGMIELWARSSWNDGTGMPAGTLISGTVWIDVQQLVPAPGVLAVFGLAGLCGRRRRRA
jgi:hypothetical protein